jgi:tyrosine-protein phosphatase YwqE
VVGRAQPSISSSEGNQKTVYQKGVATLVTSSHHVDPGFEVSTPNVARRIG